jgi:hypothetical protein
MVATDLLCFCSTGWSILLAASGRAGEAAVKFDPKEMSVKLIGCAGGKLKHAVRLL